MYSNMNNRFLRIFPVMAAAFLLAACTQDELAEQAGILPEGKYPLQIGSVSITADVDQQPWSAGAPQTRVSENDDRGSSHWDNGDKIKVQIGNGTPGTYTYQAGSLIVAEGDAPAYWASKASLFWHGTPLRAAKRLNLTSRLRNLHTC